MQNGDDGREHVSDDEEHRVEEQQDCLPPLYTTHDIHDIRYIV